MAKLSIKDSVVIKRDVYKEGDEVSESEIPEAQRGYFLGSGITKNPSYTPTGNTRYQVSTAFLNFEVGEYLPPDLPMLQNYIDKGYINVQEL